MCVYVLQYTIFVNHDDVTFKSGIGSSGTFVNAMVDGTGNTKV